MTVSSQLTKVIQVGNGVTTDIPFANVVFESEDLTVLQTELSSGDEFTLVDGIDYTVLIAIDNQSATVQLTIATSAQFSNTVLYSVPVTQLTVYAEGGEFPAQSHEDALDKLTLIALTQQESLDRSLLIPSSVVDFDNELPPPLADGVLTIAPDGKSILYQLFEDAGLTPNPMSWEGNWEQRTYNALNVVLDNGWTMIANKQTDDRAAPLPVGDAENNTPVLPLFVTDSNVSLVRTGHLYTFTKDGWITQIQIWVPDVAATIFYRIILIDETIPSAPITTIIDNPILIPNAWVTIGLGATVTPEGTKIRVVLEAINIASESEVTGDWRFDGFSNNNPPSTNGWNHSNDDAIVRIDKTDLDLVDRSAALASMTAGTTIRYSDKATPAVFREFSVIADPVDQGTYFEYTTILSNNAGTIATNAVCELLATVPVAQATNYSNEADYWPGNLPSYGNVEGFKTLANVVQPNQENFLFGVDLTFQEAAVSPDWEVVSGPGGGGSGGGDGGVVAITLATFKDSVDYVSGTTTQLTLAVEPNNETNTQIYFDGVYQEKDTYTLTGFDIDFNDPIPLGTDGVEISVIDSSIVNIGIPGDGTVTSPKFGDLTFLETRDVPTLIPVAITGVHVVTQMSYHTLGTAGADYAVTLPTAVTAGARVAFYALDSLSDIVTITPNGSDTIGPAGVAYGMAANDYLLLESNGAGLWRIVGREGLVYVTANSDAGQVLVSFSTPIEYEDNIIDLHKVWTGTNLFTAPRDGIYDFWFSIATTTASNSGLNLQVNGVTQFRSINATNNGEGIAAVATPIKLSYGDEVLCHYQSSQTRSTTANFNRLYIAEQ